MEGAEPGCPDRTGLEPAGKQGKLQGYYGTINCYTPLITINKITPSVKKNYLFKRLDSASLYSPTLIKISYLSQLMRDCVYQTLIIMFYPRGIFFWGGG